MELTLEKKLQGFPLIAQEKLQAILCSIPGTKDLIIQPELIKPLENICSASWLKLKGVRRIFKFDAKAIIPRDKDMSQVFMVRSDFGIYLQLLKQIEEIEKNQPTDPRAAIKYLHIICVPNIFLHFSLHLEMEGLYGFVQLHRWSWDFLYLDKGVMCMELPKLFETVYAHRDPALLPSVASSLRILFMLCSQPKLCLFYGPQSDMMLRAMRGMGLKDLPPALGDENSFLETLIVMDRQKDYASCLLTPAIYSALLLELFQYSAGEVNTQPELAQQRAEKVHDMLVKGIPIDAPREPPPLNKKYMLRLNSEIDEIYAENRYKSFTQASQVIREQAKALGLEAQKLGEMKLEEMSAYVTRKLAKVSELKDKLLRHLSASECLVQLLGNNVPYILELEDKILNNTIPRKTQLKEIDDILTYDGTRHNALRLMCLMHLSNGLSVEELFPFMENYCNYFGRTQLPMFIYLGDAGLLPSLDPPATSGSSSSSDSGSSISQKLPAKLLSNLSNLSLTKQQQTEFQASANRLKLLINRDVEAETEGARAQSLDCPSFVFNGRYIPLVAQLCSLLLATSTKEDFASKLGHLESLQLLLDQEPETVYNCKEFVSAVEKGTLRDVFPLKTRKMFVFVIGGVTYSEVAACELVGRLAGADITVASDHMTSGTALMEATYVKRLGKEEESVEEET